MMLGLRGRTGAHALGQPGGAFSGLAEAVKTMLSAQGRKLDNDADRAERRGFLREKMAAEMAQKQAEPPELAPSYLLNHAGRQYVEEERPMYDALGGVVTGEDGQPVMESKSFYRPREDAERQRILIQSGFDPQTMRQIDPATQQQLLQQMSAAAPVDDGVSDDERQRFANRKAALEQRAAIEGQAAPDEEPISNAAEFMRSMEPQQPTRAGTDQPIVPMPASQSLPPSQDAANAEQFMQSLPPVPSTGGPSGMPESTGQLLQQVTAPPSAISVGLQQVPVPPAVAPVIQRPEYATRIERARRIGRADLVQALIEKAMADAR